MIEIRPATAADLEAFYGQRPQQTVKAVAVFQDGDLAAIAGVTIEPGFLVAFSDIKPGVTAPKMTYWRVAKEVMKFIGNRPVVAGPSANHPNAARLLTKLGFVRIESEHGEVYQWPN